MNKNKPINIPGFKGANQLKQKMQYETVKVGKEDNNKLILPEGQPELTQEEIVQLLRERKAKKELDRKHKRNHADKEQDVIMMEEPIKLLQKKEEIQK